jgi:alpha-L-rhamnosidase
LNRDQGDYWDSGKVFSPHCTMIPYAGLPLGSRAQAFWKVMIWDEKGDPSPWSRAASWGRGLLQATDWSASWIGASEDLKPDLAKTHPAPYFRKEFESARAIKKAIAYISGGPAWGSAFVIMHWTYYGRYGDSTILRERYAGMKQWVSYLQTRTNEKGLVTREEPNGWCLGDWCTPSPIQIPESLVNTAYFYHVTDIMAKVAQTVGENDDHDRFVKLAQKIKADFNAAFYNASKNCYWEGRQGADVFALAFGLVPDDKQELVFNSLLEHVKKTDYHSDTGILATPLLLQVLSQHERDDIAFTLMTQKDFPSFGYLLDPKNCTLWEAWNGDGSRCHPMFGSVVAWFYYGLGGIKADPDSAGMQHFTIEPKTVAGLEFCKSSYNSLYGRIRSEWKKMGNGKHQFLIEVPANTTATFVVPGQKSGVKDELVKSIPVRKSRGKFTVEVKAGIYRFEA